MDLKVESVILLLLACGIGLSIAAHLFAVFPFDLKATHELQEIKNPVFSSLMVWVSALGAPVAEAILIGSAALILVLTAILKVLVGRPRPPLYPQNPIELFLAIDQYSFPSGHVLFFVVFFGFMAYLGWVHLSGWLRWLTLGVCTFLIVAIAPSRIYVGAHWASDVIGSYVIGTLLLIILILLYCHTVERQRAVAT
jgi:membrane-associated phospholipid phosphatase